ncbi:MAG: NAD(P)H-binding protein [Alcanivoracaceae bacterium]|jgi:uncharacterized protein YbjT (DUF2867 family)|nr:NAD(P)H-binding protein [Alcanivoracaceae bacterium]
MSRRAVVLGATGLVGGLLLQRLLQRDDWQQVTVLGRRAPDASHPKLHFVEADLGNMADYASEFSCDDVFCCLGTTLRQAGSKEAFARVDLDYCVAAAEQAKAGGATRFVMISAVNANRNGVSFYARTKGQAEQQVSAKNIPATFFVQPSLLKGKRSEFRFGEEFGLKTIGLVMPLVRWSQADWLPIEAETVADAMVAAALLGPESGVHRLRYRDLQEYAQQLR